ncbi:MAG: glycosyltransferase [bacterium]|nr:glycosyltransferase [bacterium]
MRVLILSCSTGGGHNMAARAIEERMLARGHEAKAIDMMALAGRRHAKVVGGIYVGIVRHIPALFRFGYFLGSKVTSSRIWSPVYYANAGMGKYLARYLAQHEQDVIVTTHLFCAETLTYLKRKQKLTQPVIFVGTDYTCIPFFEEAKPDYYVIASEELKEECVKRGIPEEKLYGCGIPTALAFSSAQTKEEARRELSLDCEGSVYLIMAGSMGFGKVPLLAYELAARMQPEDFMVVICGNNKKLKKLMMREFKGRERVRVVGYTRQVAQYMKACDVIYTKPGGLSSTEAAVSRTPIIHTAQIPGCETCNMEFFHARGMSFASARIKTQIAQGMMLAGNPDMAAGMRAAQKHYIKGDASLRIAELIESLPHENGA